MMMMRIWGIDRQFFLLFTPAALFFVCLLVCLHSTPAALKVAGADILTSVGTFLVRAGYDVVAIEEQLGEQVGAGRHQLSQPLPRRTVQS